MCVDTYLVILVNLINSKAYVYCSLNLLTVVQDAASLKMFLVVLDESRSHVGT